MLRYIHVFIIMIVSLLQSAGGRAQPPQQGVVTQIEVAVTHEGSTSVKTYSDPENMKVILDHLRLSNPTARAEIAPETFRADSYEFKLLCSDGTQRTYRQIYNLYLKREDDAWRKITPKGDLLFSPLWRIMAPGN